MLKRSVIFFLLLLAIQHSFSPKVFGQEKDVSRYVFRLQISGGRLSATVIQTGFRLKGVNGIITALHGVAGASLISARNNRNEIIRNLKIEAVDINNDLALLVSSETEKQFSEGMEQANIISVVPRANLYALGYPQGIELYKKDVLAGQPVRRELRELIPPSGKVVDAFIDRKSPSLDVEVISLDGNLVKGHSGAPVLNLQNQVVGVVNGGILGGAAAISWAIPISNVRFRNDATTLRQLSKLASTNPNELFDLEEVAAQTDESSRVQNEEIKVPIKGTGAVFNGKIVISVHEIDTRGRVTATVGSAGYQNTEIRGQIVGYSFTYDAPDRYQIRLAEISPDSTLNYLGRGHAKFQVTRLSDHSNTQSSDKSEVKSYEVTVQQGGSGTISDMQLIISVQSVEYGYRQGNKVTATIGSPGYSNAGIKGKKVGHTSIYKKGAEIFEIRISSAEVYPSYATFQVTKVK